MLEGVAQRGADLVDAAERDAGIAIPTLRVDGGMTDNPTFVQALADAARKKDKDAAIAVHVKITKACSACHKSHRPQ